jgi:hypothetical protein
MTADDISYASTIVGYDPGFGNTKVCVDGRVGMIQSAVSRPKAEATTLRSTASKFWHSRSARR